MKRVRRNPDVMWREEEESLDQAREALDRGDAAAGELGAAILFHGGTVLSLNILGAEVWEVCEGHTLDEIVAELLERFDVAEEELRADVCAFLNDLEQKGFLIYGD